MPNKIHSKAQARLLQAVAHGWKKPGGGPSVVVAKEMLATQRKPISKLPARVKRRKSK